MTYNAVHKLVRFNLKAKLKVPRPSHPKTTRTHDGLPCHLCHAAPAATQLQQAIPLDNRRPAKIWASDESRFCLHTTRRRHLTSRGVKPIGIHQHRFENTWVFGAVEPATGASHFMEFPTLNAAM